MHSRKMASPKSRTNRHPWQFRRAYGIKHSFTWFTARGMEAAERRLENHRFFLDGLSDQALEIIMSYDGPWVAGTGMSKRKDLPVG